MTARATAPRPNSSGLMAQYPWLRRVRHKQSCGQSAAVRSGVAAARAPLVVTLDGDGQNDPAFIPALLRALEAGAPRSRADRRPARRAQGERLQEIAIAHRQRGARRDPARRHARHRLRAEGVPPRRVPAAALFRRPASLPAGAGPARGLRHRLCRRGRSAARRTACRITGCGTGCGSAFSILPACGG